MLFCHPTGLLRSVTGRKLNDFTDLMLPLQEPLAGAEDLLELRAETLLQSATLASALSADAPLTRGDLAS